MWGGRVGGREVRAPLGAESKERQNEYVKETMTFNSRNFISLNKIKSSTDDCDLLKLVLFVVCFRLGISPESEF